MTNESDPAWVTDGEGDCWTRIRRDAYLLIGEDSTEGDPLTFEEIKHLFGIRDWGVDA